jgi:hypothetical protein
MTGLASKKSYESGKILSLDSKKEMVNILKKKKPKSIARL